MNVRVSCKVPIIRGVQNYRTDRLGNKEVKRGSKKMTMEFLAKVATMPKMYLTCYKILYLPLHAGTPQEGTQIGRDAFSLHSAVSLCRTCTLGACGQKLHCYV